MDELIEMAFQMSERGMHVLVNKDCIIVMNEQEWNAYLNEAIGY